MSVDSEQAQTHRCYRHPDRETLVSCSSCGRYICTSCMTPAAVGIRCPECAGGSASGGRRRMVSPGSRGAVVTMALIVANVLVFLAQLVQSGSAGAINNRIVADGGVDALTVADGEIYRLVTAAFIHAGIAHIAFNMFGLWILGAALENYLGSPRMLLIYASSVVWGSAGAILLSPDALTVGASGGVFGLMGALLVLSRHRGMEMMRSALGPVLLLNLVFTFAIPGISIGGHLGGLAGGAVAAAILGGFGRGHMAYGRLTPILGAAAVVLVIGGIIAGVGAAHLA
ncbi:MAG: rhomboid family intramembrane serine protease [Actinobacteria bacterium]|nr:rhomboid family intramembrane serine protease [Thermoleophilia bacterium]MCB9011814.1 rhomboid family intramembrane serine protease [Actinomycetota bacterium]